MTILEIKTAVASYLNRTLSDLVVNGQDLALEALNQVRLAAELSHDFNFNRKLLTLNVDSVTGGSLDDAVIVDTATTVDLKTIIDIGEFDQYGNFIPVCWTTRENSQEQQRQENPYRGIRYPSDGQITSLPMGQRRYVLAGDDLFYYPKPETSATLAVGIDAYVCSSDWEANQTVAVTGVTGVTAFNGTYYLTGSYGGRGLWINADPLTAGLPPGNIARVIFYDGSAWFITTAADLGTANTGNYASTAASSATLPSGLVYTGNGTVTGTPVVSGVTSTLVSSNDIWTKKGAQYLQWAAIDQLNRRFKEFVPRQEGNLSSPIDLANAGLETLKEWDIYRYEQFRMSSR